METTYDRPVKGKLMITLENGESWEATPEDLAKFRLVTRHDAYMAFNNALDGILRDAGLLGEYQDVTYSQLNPLRYLVERAVSVGGVDLEDHGDIADIERVLRERAGVSNNAPDPTLDLDGRRSLFSGPEVRRP